MDELNQNVKSFQEIIEEVCNPLFKKDISKPRVQNCPIVDESNQPWFNGNCKQKREVFFRTLDVYRLNKDDNDYRVNMVKARSDYKKVLRNSRMEYRKLQTQQLEMHRYDNAKSYWKLLKQACSTNSPKTITSQNFADYFKAINNPDSRFFQPDEDILYFNQRYLDGELGVMFEELNVQISMQEIRKAVQMLKNGKSSGPDLFLNEFLKYGINSLISYLHTLFNKIFDTGVYPESWGDGFIVPLHKKGNVGNVENYRGITLLSVVSKLFTSILNTRLNEWAEQYQVYVEAQSGFRKGMSTIDNIYVLHSLITHCINEKKEIICCSC